MTSFQLSVTPHRRVAARFVSAVRRRLQRAYAEAPEIRQTDIARALGVHRSVINRQLRGHQDMTLGRVAELSWALGYEPVFDLASATREDGCNARDDLRARFQTAVKTTDAQRIISEPKTLEMSAP